MDDGSKDSTRDVLKELDGKGSARVIPHEHNKGKGVAVCTGMAAALGDVLLIQDTARSTVRAITRPCSNLLRRTSRMWYMVLCFLGGARRVAMFWHMAANYLPTFMTNILYNIILTYMETGHKVFHREILKRKFRIFEVPITFNPRNYSEGKKIKLNDAFEAV